MIINQNYYINWMYECKRFFIHVWANVHYSDTFSKKGKNEKD